jgi:hypothetical protein
MLETIKFNDTPYPKFQSEGFAAQFAFPFASKIIKDANIGFDIGCNRVEWALPGAIPIDPVINEYDAMHLPEDIYPEYIFSSHMLEHYKGSWVDVLEYWKTKLQPGGILFLYLPHYSQLYWRSFNNRKHVHNFTPAVLKDYFMNGGWTDIFVTEGWDLNNSFYAVARKA